MNRFRHALPTVVVAMLVAVVFAGPLLAQDGGRRGDRRRGMDWESMSDEQREQMRERFEERRAEMKREEAQRMREDLELSEEEYGAIEPMIDRVRELTRESFVVGFSGQNRGRGGRGGPGDQGRRGGFGRGGNPFGDVEMSSEGQKLQDATEALREALDKEEPSSDEIKDRLAGLRKSRIAMQDALRKAREELRGFVTPKQEASLVLQGILD